MYPYTLFNSSVNMFGKLFICPGEKYHYTFHFEMNKAKIKDFVIDVADTYCRKSYFSRSQPDRITVACANRNCNWKFGVAMKGAVLKIVSTTFLRHIEGCPYAGRKTSLSSNTRLKAGRAAIEVGAPQTKNALFMCRYLAHLSTDVSNADRRAMQMTMHYLRRKYCITHNDIVANKIGYYDLLRENGFRVEGNDDNITCIIMPYAQNIVKHFSSPIFLDATFTSDSLTIIHASCPTTTNRLIIVGLVLCPSETKDAIYMLMDNVAGEQHVTFVTDSGTANLSALKLMGDRCSHMLCTWHLAEKLPRSIITPMGTFTQREIRNLFYNVARGTLYLFEDLKNVLDYSANPELSLKLYELKEKWCRRYSTCLRRDYITNLSESLNGAVKRLAESKNQFELARAFIQHSMRAYNDSCIEAQHLPAGRLMPLVFDYLRADMALLESLDVQLDGDVHKIFFRDRVVGNVRLVDNHYKCDCHQYEDLGTVCAHILKVNKNVPLEEYTHPIWQTSVFAETFKVECPFLPSLAEGKRVPRSPNKVRISDALRMLPDISDKKTEEILHLIKTPDIE